MGRSATVPKWGLRMAPVDAAVVSEITREYQTGFVEYLEFLTKFGHRDRPNT